MKKSQLVGLRCLIAAFAAQGQEIRRQIQKAIARARYDLWNDKRSLGSDARMALLAYAFLRDVPYRVAEPTAVAPVGRTEEQWRRSLAQDIAPYVCKERVTPAKDIEAWLALPEQIDRKARREAASRAGYERGRAMRAARAVLRERGAA